MSEKSNVTSITLGFICERSVTEMGTRFNDDMTHELTLNNF
jgi:hypothetical protein